SRQAPPCAARAAAQRGDPVHERGDQDPTRDGSHVLTAGTKVITRSTRIIGTKNGSTPLMTCVTGTFVTEESTKSTSPTGGVSRPIIRLKIIMTAKWVGSIP